MISPVHFAASLGLSVGKAFLFAAVTFVICELVARAGARLLTFVAPRRLAGPEEAGVSILLGWAVIGGVYLGLALTGLFYAALIIAAPILLAIISRHGRSRSWSLLGGILRAWQPRDIIVATAVILAVTPIFLGLVSPAIQLDPYMYHLAAPWLWLQSHRMIIDHVLTSFHIPLPADIVYSLALAVGDDRLAKWIVLTHFLAASAVAAPLLARASSSREWALSFIVPLATVSIAQWLPSTKNDVIAASLLVAGASLYPGRAWVAGALLLGCGVAAKPTGIVLALAWVILNHSFRGPATRRSLTWALVLIVVPLTPWMAKCFIAKADIFFHLIPVPWATFDWDARNTYSVYERLKTSFQPGLERLTGVPREWFSYIAKSNIIAAIAIPGLVIFGTRRRPILACLLASFVILAIARTSRYMMPAIWLICFFVIAEIKRLPSRIRNLTVFATIAAAIAIMWISSPSLPYLVRQASSPAAESRRRHFAIHEDIALQLAILGIDRYLCIGELRTYRLPGRPVHVGGIAETPLIWKLAHSSRTVAELRKRIRQTGADFILYNFVSVEWIWRHSTHFTWSKRALGLYYDFCRKHLEVAIPPRLCDSDSGGYYIFRVPRAPANPPRDSIFFMPGAETIDYTARALRDSHGQPAEAIRRYRRLLHDFPGVGTFATQLAIACSMRGDWSCAYSALKPFITMGMVDAANLPTFGIAALNTGRLTEASDALERSIEIYHHRANHNRVNLALVHLARAGRNLADGALASAKTDIARAEALLLAAREHESADLVDPYRQTAAMASAIKARLLARCANNAEARSLLLKSLDLAPDMPEAMDWRRELSRIDEIIREQEGQ